MSRISFDNYGRLAKSDHSFTVIAGRYSAQQAAEEKIPLDILSKLDMKTEYNFLDIGCGTGNLLIPLSAHVSEVTGIDHPFLIKLLKQRSKGFRFKGITGNFLDLEIAGHFDRILIYSVLHYLSDEDEVVRFIDKALGLLKAGGKMLIGDIPNQDMKERFLSSPEGKSFIKQWRREMEEAPNLDLDLPDDPETATFDDAFMSRLIASIECRNFICTILGQPPDLPFGNSRYDLLIENRE